MKKYVIVGAVLLSMFVGSVTFAQTAPGNTVEVRIAELQAQVNKLLAEISRLRGGSVVGIDKPLPIEYKPIKPILNDGVGTIPTRPDSKGPFITITSPLGGENWTVGKTYSITWKVDGELGTRTIHLINTSNGEKVDKYLGSTNENSFNYTVSSAVTPDGQYELWVCGRYCAYDGGIGAAVKISIGKVQVSGETKPVTGKVYPQIVVVTPNGGESLVPGKTAKVEWKGGNPNATVQISLVQLNSYNASINHGVPVLTSLTTTKNDGSEEVKIPASIREGRYFMVVETVRPVGQNESLNMDYSDHQFVVSSKKNAAFVVADVNNDGKVNGEDKEIIFDNLGECSKYPKSFVLPQNFCHADLNNNGTVDERDAEIVNRYIRR